MSNKVRKLVIPVAGLGTRFLPATKAQPKEMLPLLDKPVIQYIVEEAVKAGITDIIMVTGPTKRAIEDHFDRNEQLEKYCLEAGKSKACQSIKEVAELANFIYIRQKGPYGNGTPVLNAKGIIGREPFAVVWGDDVWNCGKKSHLRQLIEVYEKYGDPVITAKLIDDEGTSRYGVVEGVEVEDGIYQVKQITEKPGPHKTKSRIGSVGGYVFTPDIFEALEHTKLGKDNELWLVDAIANLLAKRPVYARVVEGEMYDLGNKFGWLRANIEYGLRDKEIKDELKMFLKSLK